MRYERKYRIREMGFTEVRQMVMMHPASFKTSYPDRQVNNIYLDTPDMELFQENLDGNEERKKFRIRWYGENISIAKKPALETKLKKNELGEKRSRPLPDMVLGTREKVLEYLHANTHPVYPLLPILLNSYKRSYFESHDKRFRVTLDQKLAFYPIENSLITKAHPVFDEVLVLEVKYEKQHDESWPDFAQFFPFRVTKNSKYVTGILLTANH